MEKFGRSENGSPVSFRKVVGYLGRVYVPSDVTLLPGSMSSGGAIRWWRLVSEPRLMKLSRNLLINPAEGALPLAISGAMQGLYAQSATHEFQAPLVT
ncbi:MAG TPA: hypothetical protein VIM48_00300 [Chthoniobacterales bacterium]